MSKNTVTIKRQKEGEPGDLVGATEAAEILGVERTRISRYVRSGIFPEPWAFTKATKLWLRTEVEEFKKLREDDGLRGLAGKRS